MGDVIELGRSPTFLEPVTPGNQRIEFDQPGGSLLERIGAGLPATTEGKVRFLERIYGPGKVKTTPQGEILVPTADGQALRPFNERDLSLGDVASLFGEAIPALTSAAGGAIGAAVGSAAPGAGTAAGAIGGSVVGGGVGGGVRNALAEVVTGGTGQTPTERVVEIGTEAALGGLGGAVGEAGALVFDALRPHNFVVRQFDRLRGTPQAVEGRRLSQQTGIPLTPAEETGSRAAGTVEAIARRTPGGADTVFQFEQQRLRDAVTKLRDAMDRVRPGETGAFTVGREVTTAFESAVDTAIDLRRQQAKVDFDLVKRLSNGQPVIPPRELATEIMRLVDELDVPGAGDATAQQVGQAKRLLSSLSDGKGSLSTLTADQTQRLLQVYTNLQRGTGVLFRDMPTSQSRMVAGRLKDALLRDLDGAAAAGAGDVVDALRAARDHYRLNSAAVNELANSTLQRLIGNGTRSPEAIAERFLRLKPSEIRTSMRIIESAAPDTAAGVRRFWLQSAMEKAIPPVTQQAGGQTKFSAARFVSSLPDMDTMLAAGFDRAAILEIGRLSKVLQRVADKSGEGSPTAPLMIAWDAVKGVFSLNPTTIGRSAMAVIAPRQIAKAMTTAEGRRALETLATTRPGTKRATSALMTFLAITATEPEREDVRPME